MVKLSWDNKAANPFRTALPFQTVEVINESSAQRIENLFKLTTDWRNKLIWGDKKYVLPSLLPEFAGKVNLIYIDPPFDTGANFSFTANIGDGDEFTKQPNAIELKAYNDTWGKGLDTYLQWFYETALLLRELLADNGSIYIHLDWRLVHYVKCVMDEVFGYENFLNEIIWQSAVGDTSAKNRKFIKSHDTILLYKKGSDWTWNDIFQEYSEASLRLYSESDEKGKFQLVSVDNPGGGGYIYELGLGEKRPANGYRMPKETALKWLEEKILVVEKGKVPRKKSYMGEGVRCKDIWTDISGSVSKIYPTQKPEALLERIIKASSNEGDLVLDCFCGSGTTAAVAEKLNRRWIVCDLGRFAIHTTRKRLLQISGVRPFEVLNLGKYERQVWATGVGATQDGLEAYYDFMMALYGGERVKHYVWIHGKKKGRLVHIGGVDAPVSVSDVRSAVTEFKKLMGSGKGSAPEKMELDILGWDFAFEMNELAKVMAAEMGVKVRYFKIPSEVMDNKAREQGDIKFFELAALDVKVSKKHRTVTLELNDFMMPLSDVPDEVQRSVREWSDWIDYWAVDWDFKGDAFHNESQRYRTKKERKLDKRMEHVYEAAGTYRILIKVIDILGNDTTKALQIEVK